jgi:hypothetical protein
MYRIEVAYSNENLTVTDKILPLARVYNKCVEVNTTCKYPPNLDEFTGCDLLIIDKARPNSDMLRKIISTLNIKFEQKYQIELMKNAIIENAHLLKTLNQYEPFQNVKLIILRYVETAIVLDKKIFGRTRNLNSDERKAFELKYN